ncbi:SoxR reducing system RseC family protein [Pasteurella bettyae]|uniref:Positive regulator of sigma(E), RseC/MucC n=1 Tax=Pasteurella bettyae CCUG 2042 TaxID=1095749 RepID=I3DBE2_9PAST|nr:SoxR reducing system RseC family protein [Pasteurella bettyae]EIJ69035.1 positive regulator of sigma(E), RseC/MucC [Pasteurella bettyae CCUG 2042]SUB22884.1 putative regulator of sigma(E), RseC/MucC family [Pasteurella bettyae]
MLTESAVVINYQAGQATVKCQAKSACGSCAAKTACGTSVLSELTGEMSEHILTVETITPLQVGQQVEIGLEERSLIFSALLVYVVPLITLLFSTFIAEQLFTQEWISALFIFILTALSFFAVSVYSKKINKKSAFKPILLRVIN